MPQESHSPTKRPSSPVVNRSGAPHLRQGRPRGAAPSENSRRGSRRRSGSGSASADSGRRTVVVSHSPHTARTDPPRPARNVRTEPHSSHSGASSATSIGAPTGVAPELSGAGARWWESVEPSTKANSFWQAGQVPVRNDTALSENSISTPHAGHEFVMGLGRSQIAGPLYFAHVTLNWASSLSGPLQPAGRAVILASRSTR